MDETNQNNKIKLKLMQVKEILLISEQFKSQVKILICLN